MKYYFNNITGDSTWDRPLTFIEPPEVQLLAKNKKIKKELKKDPSSSNLSKISSFNNYRIPKAKRNSDSDDNSSYEMDVYNGNICFCFLFITSLNSSLLPSFLGSNLVSTLSKKDLLHRGVE